MSTPEPPEFATTVVISVFSSEGTVPEVAT